DVHKQGDDAGDGIPFDELAGTVHRSVEVCFALNLLPPFFGLLLIDQSGIKVCIDAHLLTRHGVQRESCTDFSYTLHALRDDDEVNHNQYEKHDKTDGQIPLSDEQSKGFNH